MAASFFQVMFECRGRIYTGQVGLPDGEAGKMVKATCFPIDEPDKFRLLILSDARKTGDPENAGFSFGFIA